MRVLLEKRKIFFLQGVLFALLGLFFVGKANALNVHPLVNIERIHRDGVKEIVYAVDARRDLDLKDYSFSSENAVRELVLQDKSIWRLEPSGQVFRLQPLTMDEWVSLPDGTEIRRVPPRQEDEEFGIEGKPKGAKHGTSSQRVVRADEFYSWGLLWRRLPDNQLGVWIEVSKDDASVPQQFWQQPLRTRFYLNALPVLMKLPKRPWEKENCSRISVTTADMCALKKVGGDGSDPKNYWKIYKRHGEQNRYNTHSPNIQDWHAARYVLRKTKLVSAQEVSFSLEKPVYYYDDLSFAPHSAKEINEIRKYIVDAIVHTLLKSGYYNIISLRWVWRHLLPSLEEIFPSSSATEYFASRAMLREALSGVDKERRSLSEKKEEGLISENDYQQIIKLAKKIDKTLNRHKLLENRHSRRQLINEIKMLLDLLGVNFADNPPTYFLDIKADEQAFSHRLELYLFSLRKRLWLPNFIQQELKPALLNDLLHGARVILPRVYFAPPVLKLSCIGNIPDRDSRPWYGRPEKRVKNGKEKWVNLDSDRAWRDRGHTIDLVGFIVDHQLKRLTHVYYHDPALWSKMPSSGCHRQVGIEPFGDYFLKIKGQGLEPFEKEDINGFTQLMVGIFKLQEPTTFAVYREELKAAVRYPDNLQNYPASFSSEN